MSYVLRKGIILTEICDQYLLIATKTAREYCPYILHINESAAFIYKQLENGLNIDEINQGLLDEFDIDQNVDTKSLIEECLKEYANRGYIVKKSEDLS